MTTAILTAGGTGTRMGNNVPKQFITVNEKPIIIYTLQKFQECDGIDEIVVACVREWQPMLGAYCKEFGITKTVHIVDGGETGIDSIKNSLKVLDQPDNDDIILIHDGNRPLVDDKVIKENISTAQKVGATSTYIDIHDGIVRVDDALNILGSNLKREHIKSTQTPHCFRFGVMKEVVDAIDDESKYISIADAAANLGYNVALVKGSEINFKITTPNDLVLFEALINTRPRDV